MPNFLEALRLKNLFGNIGSGDVPPPMDLVGGDFTDKFKGESPYSNISFGPTNVPMPQSTQDDDFNVAQRMAELYSPEHAASDRFDQLIGGYPQFQEPGKLRKIGGAILGSLTDLGTNLGGNRAGVHGTDVFDEATGRHDYEKAVLDWKNKIPPTQAAANLERNNNTNERTMAHQTVQNEITARRDDARAKSTEESNKIKADRAEVYRLKSLAPNYKFDFSGPTVIMADPATGKVTDTGLKTGSLSDADKLALQQENALEKIHTTGDETRKTEDVKHTNRTEEIHTRGDEARNTKGTPSASLTNKGETPTQTKVRQFNSAKEFAAKNPDLAKFIKFGKSNDFTISPPSQGGFFSSAGPTKAQHDAITAAVFGDALQVPQPTRTGASTSTPAPGKPSTGAPTTGVRVKDPRTGKTGTYKGSAEQAKKAGYQVIG